MGEHGGDDGKYEGKLGGIRRRLRRVAWRGGGIRGGGGGMAGVRRGGRREVRARSAIVGVGGGGGRENPKRSCFTLKLPFSLPFKRRPRSLAKTLGFLVSSTW